MQYVDSSGNLYLAKALNTSLSMGITSDGSSKTAYYVLPEKCEQLQDLISHRNMNAQIGEIFRECYRYGLSSHSDELRGAKKILFYAQAEIERLEKNENKRTG